MKKLLMAAVVLLSAVASQAGDHSKRYIVGIVIENAAASSGSTYEYCGGSSCATVPTASYVRRVKTETGIYSIFSPFSVGWFGPQAPKHWFVDDLEPGDKLLFGAWCHKNGHCVFMVPDPDRPGKEIKTEGRFSPFHPKSNTAALCGTGKLAPAVEAQACH